MPESHLLLIQNEDRPGVIGNVGHVLGDHDINIARMQCSREERGGHALQIFGLDAPLPTAVLDQIKKSKHILSVKVADLSKGL
ncbi:MAG: ACT domain-containing protein [Nitrospiraceae bacterium]